MNEFVARRARVNEWFAPARVGIFYHWGLFTGGGSSEAGKWHTPLRYPTVAALEAEADPDRVAANMVTLAQTVGARYIIFTLLHSGERWCVLHPTRVPGFLGKTNHDYVGALLNRCATAGLRLILYVPAGPGPANWDVPQPPLLTAECRAPQVYLGYLKQLIAELAARHGDRLGGFWFDGIWERDIPEFVHGLLPHAIVTINNQTSHFSPGVDYGTTEFLSGPCDPPYCRPSGPIHANDTFSLLPPKRDFNEDIPTCNNWWHGSPYEAAEQLRAKPYVTDPTYFVKELVSSLGQRRQWNYALGLGPQIDGTAPPMFAPMIETMRQFMAWAGESIYDTEGGEGSMIQPGWVNHGGFISVTRSRREPAVHYVLVTTPPGGPSLTVQHNGVRIVSATDLRTGQAVYAHPTGHIEFPITDWSDVRTYGAKVLKLVTAD